MMSGITMKLALIGVVGFGAVIGLSIPRGQASQGESYSASFSICHMGGGTNCVVDGDTAWINGTKVRIADIDAPETHSPRCASEAALGNRATVRMAELINAGPFEMASADRDEDRYGRKLRILMRSGRSLGDQLVSEGLARPYAGGRKPWC